LREWKQLVAEHARSAIEEPRALTTEPVALRLLYLYEFVSVALTDAPAQDVLP
jgi:hypothetical protein